jgi:hypothetical protein
MGLAGIQTSTMIKYVSFCHVSVRTCTDPAAVCNAEAARRLAALRK